MQFNDEEITELVEETEEEFSKSIPKPRRKIRKDRQSLMMFPNRGNKPRTIVNRRIEVYWENYENWYPGFVRRKLYNGNYAVKYDDEESSIEEDLESELWKFIH